MTGKDKESVTLPFTCPECGGHQLRELWEKCYLVNLIEIQDYGNGPFIEQNGDQDDATPEYGTLKDYACWDCGEVIPVKTEEELVEYVKKQNERKKP